MNTTEFREIELQIREEKLCAQNGTRREDGLWRSNGVAQDGATENQLYSERAERGL